MVLDYLPVQVTSVPSERVFSLSGETDTAKCNRIKPSLMEALQILKYLLKHMRLSFTTHLTDITKVHDELVAAIHNDLGGDPDRLEFVEGLVWLLQ